MKFLSVFVFCFVSVMKAQSAPPPPAVAMPNLPDETIVAEFDDGAKLTMGEFKKIYAALPANMQQMALANREEFLREYAWMRQLTRMAEEKKLADQSPYKEALEYSRMSVMTQAALAETLNSIIVEPPEIVKYYDTNKERFKQIQVKAIYIAFGAASGAGGKKSLTEDQAKAKALGLLAQIRGGADFVKLAKENSDDETSRSRNGDFATLRPADNIPDAIRAAIFALKQGGETEPVRQPNGYYLFRAEAVTYAPLSQVRDQIFTEVKNQRYKDWLDQGNRSQKVKFPNPAFFGPSAVIR
jgi:peptidyl-prolyl cis-trans isomerase C